MTLNAEGVIPIIGGIFAYLMATGRYNPSKDPVKWKAWRTKWGKTLMVIAPIVILFGVAQFLGLLGQ